MGNVIYRLLQRFWYVFIRGTHKNNHLFFFFRSYIRYITPNIITLKQREKKLQRFYNLNPHEQKYIEERVNFYCKFDNEIFLPNDAPSLNDFTFRKKKSYVNDYINSTYFFDAYEYTRYFPNSLHWVYNPGDINYLFPLPEITKSRPIIPGDGNKNNILLNLDKVRHFLWVTDPFKWEEKKGLIIFRGDVSGKPHRQRFINMWKDNPMCDLVNTGQTPLYNHLYYRYIMALEGNDVASNLKWVMSSNSIAVMPRPTCETWFMESKLIPNYHYIEISSDFHDLIERINYYEEHPEEAKSIIKHAHEWIQQFRNHKREELISLMVLNKYFQLTGQIHHNIKNNKYIINEVVKLSLQQKVNAQNKARLDVSETALELGFQPYGINYYKYAYSNDVRPHHYPIISKWIANIQGKNFAKQIHSGDTILIQDFYLDYMQNIATESLKRGAKVIFIIHDIQCIRFNKRTNEIKKLNNASLLLVHTNAMKKKLAELGVHTPMKVLNLFDYYSSVPMMSIEETIQHKSDIVFAGNLEKSRFLRKLLVNKTNKNIKFMLYGFLGNLDLKNNNNIIYNGVFSPDKPDSIKGGWGLVWDGSNIYSCTGDYGNYLRYNASHKLSLYLACGLPLIVWEQSALANWVKVENIGITISEIGNLSIVITAISDKDYHQMVLNARSIGEKIRNGYYLKQALNNS